MIVHGGRPAGGVRGRIPYRAERPIAKDQWRGLVTDCNVHLLSLGFDDATLTDQPRRVFAKEYAAP